MNTTHRRLSIACSAATLALLGACSSSPFRHDTASSSYGGVSQAPINASPRIAANDGTVSDIQVVPVSSHSSAAGAVLGGIAGAVVGNQIGHGTGRAAATGAGAIGGAVIGDRIANRDQRDDEIYRVTVRFDDGHEAAYDYRTVGDLRVGDRVRADGGQLYRM